MKKTWSAPEVMEVTLNETALNTFTGTEIDGFYVDGTCEEKPAYES